MTPAPLLSQEERREQLARLQRAYPIQTDTGGWQDYLEYFGNKHIHRFAGVTHHGDFFYIKANYENRCAAKRAVTENLFDSIYEETPVAVVDLDLWRFWYPSGRWVPANQEPGKYIYVIEFPEGEIPKP